MHHHFAWVEKDLISDYSYKEKQYVRLNV